MRKIIPELSERLPLLSTRHSSRNQSSDGSQEPLESQVTWKPHRKMQMIPDVRKALDLRAVLRRVLLDDRFYTHTISRMQKAQLPLSLLRFERQMNQMLPIKWTLKLTKLQPRKLLAPMLKPILFVFTLIRKEVFLRRNHLRIDINKIASECNDLPSCSAIFD